MKKFLEFINENKTGILSFKDNIYNLKFFYKKNKLYIDLYLNNMKYQPLSILIPDSENLNKNEFFINPEVDLNLIEELIKQNFISKGENVAIAGDVETKSYFLNFS
jgi:hypothetical protein